MSKTVSGELITIDDSAYDGLDDIVIYGNTVQNLWVNPSGTRNGVTVTSNADGSVTVSGTATGGVYANVKTYALKPGAQYTLSIDKMVDDARGFYIDVYNESGASIQVIYVGGNQGAYLSDTFTLDNRAVFVLCGFGVNQNGTVSGTYRVMLNEGSEAEPWCPPGLNSVGDDGSVKIVTAGKNLFNAVSGDKINVGPDGEITLVAGFSWAQFSSQRIHIPKGTKITLSKSVTLGAFCGPGVWLRDYSGHREEFYAYGSTNKNTYETTRDYYYITCFVNDGTVTADTPFYVQLELGSTATAYEPPNITTTPIDLQSNSLRSLPDGTRDELHIDREGNCTLVKRVGSVTLSSDASHWTKEPEIGVRYSISISPAASSPYVPGSVVSDAVPYRTAMDHLYTGTHIAASGVRVLVTVGTDETAQDIADVCGGKKLLYTLAAPQTIDLGKIDLPKLRKKPLVNKVWTNCRDTTTSFYLNTEMELTYRQWPGVRADGFKVSGKHNFWDFASCIASSDSGKPEKKFVTATVPYMSGFYDLSKIYGAIAYESRDVSYTFEILGDDMDDLQRQKTNLLDWLGLVHDEPIYDDTQPNYHYVGSFYEADWEEDETGESGTLTVTFKCQPFLIADRATEESLSVGTHTVVNHGQQVSVFAKANSGSATVKINGVIQAVTTTEQRLTAQLQPGENEVVVTSNSVTLRYYERHL